MDDRPHYSMECYFRDPSANEGFRRESIVIKAPTDEEAIAESSRAAIFRKPSFFTVSVKQPVGDIQIFNSRDPAGRPP